MKTLFRLILAAALAAVLAACGNEGAARYSLEFPVMPVPWVSLLGEPCWRVEWVDSNGVIQRKELLPGERLEINLPDTWTNPVTAWPWWPEHKLIPGLFKPAGGLFPFDVSGNSLILSWMGGIDAFFYWELASANDENIKKVPANFDWLRFRELFLTDELNVDVNTDPWTVNWQYVAEKTIDSSFDKRRLTAEKTESLSIPVDAGPWFGNSPFAQLLLFAERETPVFPVRPGVNVWISSEGILRCNGKAWVLNKF